MGMDAAERAHLQARIAALELQLDLAVRIIDGLTKLYHQEAGRGYSGPWSGEWIADPLAWVKLTEVREKPEAN
jgi:hypothetical protein